MNINTFLEIIQKTKNLLKTTEFTLLDCKFCYEKAKSIALKSTKFSKYVILEKRINYEIFRKILIPCMAERYGHDYVAEDIIKYFVEIPSKNLDGINCNSYTAQNYFTKSLLSNR
jgi:hypothetical protein